MTDHEIQVLYASTKYGMLYIKIIEKALTLDRAKLKKDNINYVYYERHHILPKSLFKEYSNLKVFKWNKVLLTAREHFICHMLLVKHYRKLEDKNANVKMSKAAFILSIDGKHNSRVYAFLKVDLSHSDETKKKIGEKSVDRYSTYSEEKKKEILEKTARTMSIIEYNGLTKMQNSHIKHTKVVKTTILENGLTIEQNSQLKRIATLKEKGSNVGDKNSQAKYYKIINADSNIIDILWKQDLIKWSKDNRINYTNILCGVNIDGWYFLEVNNKT